MRLKTFINETALQTGDLKYITSRLEDKRKYFNAKQSLEQVCAVLDDIFKDEIQFFHHEHIDQGNDPDALSLGIAGARFSGGFVSFELNPNFFNAIKSQAAWAKFVHVLSDYFHHEMVHALQDQRMSPEQRSKEAKSYFKVLQSGKDTEYFKYPAELMAFAATAVLEFRRAKLSKEQIINTLKTLDQNAAKSSIFEEYRKLFAESDKKTWNKFLRYCMEYAEGVKE